MGAVAERSVRAGKYLERPRYRCSPPDRRYAQAAGCGQAAGATVSAATVLQTARVLARTRGTGPFGLADRARHSATAGSGVLVPDGPRRSEFARVLSLSPSSPCLVRELPSAIRVPSRRLSPLVPSAYRVKTSASSGGAVHLLPFPSHATCSSSSNSGGSPPAQQHAFDNCSARCPHNGAQRSVQVCQPGLHARQDGQGAAPGRGERTYRLRCVHTQAGRRRQARQHRSHASLSIRHRKSLMPSALASHRALPRSTSSPRPCSSGPRAKVRYHPASGSSRVRSTSIQRRAPRSRRSTRSSGRERSRARGGERATEKWQSRSACALFSLAAAEAMRPLLLLRWRGGPFARPFARDCAYTRHVGRSIDRVPMPDTLRLLPHTHTHTMNPMCVYVCRCFRCYALHPLLPAADWLDRREARCLDQGQRRR